MEMFIKIFTAMVHMIIQFIQQMMVEVDVSFMTQCHTISVSLALLDFLKKGTDFARFDGAKTLCTLTKVALFESSIKNY